MALSVYPRIHLLPSFHLPFSRVRCLSKAARASATVIPKNNAAIVWFKHDLRTDDHPGLLKAASQHRIVVPLYIFDRRILSRFPDEMLELVLFAVAELRKSLQDQGSDLLIGFGNAEDILLKLVKEVKATHIFAEEEVEYNIRRLVDNVEECLSNMPLSWGNPQFVSWQTPFYDIENLKELPASYRDFQKQKFQWTTPLTSLVLPRLEMAIDRGTLPTFNDVKSYLDEDAGKLDENWTSIKLTSATTILEKEHVNQVKAPNDPIKGFEESNSSKSNGSSLTSKPTQRKRPEKSSFISREGNLVGGGTDLVLNALAAYLRYLEGTAKDDWKEMHEKLRNAESRDGASFHALFGSAIQLGTISRRRVYYEAIKYEKERNAGFLSPFGYSTTTVAAAVDGVGSMEVFFKELSRTNILVLVFLPRFFVINVTDFHCFCFFDNASSRFSNICLPFHASLTFATDHLWQWYWLMSLKCQKSNGGRYSIRIWRWNNYLIQYTVVGREGPAVLLVHGFGAFLEHYRDNISEIANGGNRVWAITLLGFGKSEKPNIVYSELVWAELLRDFIVDVVREPAHLIGNSIGGTCYNHPILTRSFIPND